MNKVKAYFKNHRAMSIGYILCFLLIVFVAVLNFTFFSNNSKAVYGDRLDGIEEVRITDNKLEQIESELNERDEVSSSDASTSGRILNVIITVNDDVSVETARSLTEVIDSAIDDDQRNYYDTQVFIKKNNDDASFPIIGYRHEDKTTYSWTKDR